MLARVDLGADEVGDQQPQQRLGLQRRAPQRRRARIPPQWRRAIRELAVSLQADWPALGIATG